MLYFLLTLSDQTEKEIKVCKEYVYRINITDEEEYLTAKDFYDKYPDRHLDYLTETFKYYEPEAGFFRTIDDIFELYKRLGKEIVILEVYEKCL